MLNSVPKDAHTLDAAQIAFRQVFHAASDLVSLNDEFRVAMPSATMSFAISNATNPVVFTNFRPLAVAFLHLVSRIRPDIPVIWVDHGFNTTATYRHVEDVVNSLGLNLHIYSPKMSAGHYQAIYGSLPEVETARHDEFSKIFKLEPFNRALEEWQPDVWLNGIRHDQNAFRKELDIFTFGSHGTVRVAPMFHLTELEVQDYILKYDLPDNFDYFDPTKGEEHRECGLLLAK
ncbi:MAG: phosphoadenosine phosphosulfate reductase family protein [Pseudomonadota bacterium]